MKHFNIDKATLVASNLNNQDRQMFVYGDNDIICKDFHHYNGITAVHDLIVKQHAGRFKRAVFLHKLIVLAEAKHIECKYYNYNQNQLKTNGYVTITGNHYISFTFNISTSKNAVVFKTTRFAHNEVADFNYSEKHAEGQLHVIKDFKELLKELNEELAIIGPKIDKLFL